MGITNICPKLGINMIGMDGVEFITEDEESHIMLLEGTYKMVNIAYQVCGLDEEHKLEPRRDEMDVVMLTLHR